MAALTSLGDLKAEAVQVVTAGPYRATLKGGEEERKNAVSIEISKST